MNTLEANYNNPNKNKTRSTKTSKIESEKINCLHRLWLRPAPRGKSNRYARTEEIIEQFGLFSLLKLFNDGNWHCWPQWKAFTHQLQMRPGRQEITVKTAVFQLRWEAKTWVVQSIAAVRQRPRTPRNWRCSFAFIVSFLWHFNEKHLAEVIFRCKAYFSKNQENGIGMGSNDLSTLSLNKKFEVLWLRRAAASYLPD